MLFLYPGTSKLIRAQGTFVSDDEVTRVTEYLADQAKPQFEEELINLKPKTAAASRKTMANQMPAKPIRFMKRRSESSSVSSAEASVCCSGHSESATAKPPATSTGWKKTACRSIQRSKIPRSHFHHGRLGRDSPKPRRLIPFARAALSHLRAKAYQ